MPGWATPWPTPAAVPRRPRAYLAAVRDAPVADAIELQRRAAMQFLISGHIDEGLADAADRPGRRSEWPCPSRPDGPCSRSSGQRARLRLRGLGFRERDPSEIAPADLTRIDVCWSAGAGLSVVDTIRGADFQARGLLLSLAAGEPSRIARALAMEAAHAASTGGSNRKTTARLLERAEDLASASRTPTPWAWSPWPGVSRPTSKGDGRIAHEELRPRGDDLSATDCTGVAWELDTAHAFALWGLSHLGEVAELSPPLADLARRRPRARRPLCRR